jgi:c-di-GMP-binding flagellar brake protein YcgR
MNEKRKFTRVSIITSVTVSFNDGVDNYDGVVTNISIGGLGIIMKTPLEVGADVRVSFEVNSRLKFENMRGFVVRTDTVGNKFFTFIGVNFLNVDADKRAQLNKFVLDRRLQEYVLKTGGENQ